MPKKVLLGVSALSFTLMMPLVSNATIRNPFIFFGNTRGAPSEEESLQLKSNLGVQRTVTPTPSTSPTPPLGRISPFPTPTPPPPSTYNYQYQYQYQTPTPPPSSPGGRGMVSISFDDGWRSAYNLAPLLDQRGIKATFYLPTQVNLGLPGFITWGEATLLERNGHEIGAHSRTHANLTTLSSEAAWNEIKGSSDDLVGRGFRPVTFAYPFGASNPTIQQFVQDVPFAGARGTFTTFNSRNQNRFLLKSHSLDQNATFEEIKDNINTAARENLWYIIVIHEVNSSKQYSISRTLAEEIINYIDQSNVPVVTIAEGLTKMSALR